MGMLHDRSTQEIKRKLATPRCRNVVEAHEGIASVGVDGATKPQQHNRVGDNAAANAEFNDSTGGPAVRPNTVMIGGR